MSAKTQLQRPALLAGYSVLTSLSLSVMLIENRSVSWLKATKPYHTDSLAIYFLSS